VFAREGAAVAITGRRKDQLERVVRDIERTGKRALAIAGSVTNEADVREAVAATVRAFGRLDVLVNNAGNVFHAAPLHETTDEIWDQTFDVFTKGTFRFIRAVIPQMLKQGGGSILNISTVAGLKGIPIFEGHSYQAAKAGVNMLTKTVAVHYATHNIRCNCLCPAGVETPGVSDLLADPQAKAMFSAFHPLGRLGRPEEVAEAAIYFASNESSWTTGSILTVDGGVMAA
jgi:NAD(P)-dependent dehydrogenase (short-subunit alcohol dehydrogenase family)